MERVEIDISAGEHELLGEGVADGSYASIAEYVGALVREEAKRRAQEKLEAMLLEGLNSGPGRPWEDYMEELRARIKSRA